MLYQLRRETPAPLSGPSSFHSKYFNKASLLTHPNKNTHTYLLTDTNGP